MFQWKGAAGLCINENNQLLMVLQAAPDEEPNGRFLQVGLKATRRLKNVVYGSLRKRLD